MQKILCTIKNQLKRDTCHLWAHIKCDVTSNKGYNEMIEKQALLGMALLEL